MTVHISVCESCLDAVGEEALAAPEECEMLCISLGQDITDHLCEEIETDGLTRCGCACHPAAKQRLRRGIKALGAQQ